MPGGICSAHLVPLNSLTSTALRQVRGRACSRAAPGGRDVLPRVEPYAVAVTNLGVLIVEAVEVAAHSTQHTGAAQTPDSQHGV